MPDIDYLDQIRRVSPSLGERDCEASKRTVGEGLRDGGKGATLTKQGVIMIGTISLFIEILSLIFLIIYVIKTWEMASATRKAAESTEQSVAEMRETRIQETAPYVVGYFDIDESGFIYFVVKNFGKTPAKNISFEFTPPLEATDEINAKFIVDGINTITPEFEFRALIDLFPAYFGNGTFPLAYKVKTSYYDSEGRYYKSVNSYDLSSWSGIMSIKTTSIKDIEKALKNIGSKTDKVQKAIDNLTSVTKTTQLFIPSYVTLDEEYSIKGLVRLLKSVKLTANLYLQEHITAELFQTVVGQLALKETSIISGIDNFDSHVLFSDIMEIHEHIWKIPTVRHYKGSDNLTNAGRQLADGIDALLEKLNEQDIENDEQP